MAGTRLGTQSPGPGRPSAATCPMKVLLLRLSSREAGNGLEEFARYFDGFLRSDDSAGISSLAATAERSLRSDCRSLAMLKQLFRPEEPATEPAFLSFFNRQDLSRLSQSCGVEFTIHISSRGSRSKKAPDFLAYFDPRGLWIEDPPSIRHFVLLQGNVMEAECLSGLENLECSIARSTYFTRGPVLRAVAFERFGRRKWIAAVDRLLELLRPNASVSRGESENDDDDEANWWPPQRPGQFQGLRKRLWLRWKTRVFFYAFVGIDGRCLKSGPQLDWLFRRLKSSPQLSVFHPLTFVRPPDESVQEAVERGAVFVCWFGSDCLAEIAAPFVASLSSRLTSGHSASQDEPFSLPRFKEVPRLSEDDRLRAQTLWKAKKRRSPEKTKECWCAECTGSTLFDDNMSTSGPERLMTSRHTAKDLACMLGLNDLLGRDEEASGDLISRATSFSVASMDIESRTSPVFTASEADTETFCQMLGPRVGQTLRFVQKPVMIAHVDQLTVDLDPCDPRRCCLTVRDDSETALFELFEAYWDYVVYSHRAASVAKARILMPLFVRVEQYKKAFFDYCVSWKAGDKKRLSDRIDRLESDLSRQNEEDLRADLSSFVSPSTSDKKKRPSFSAVDNNDDDDDDVDDDEEEGEEEGD